MNLAILKISGKFLEEFINTSAGADLIKNLRTKYSAVILIHGGGKVITEWMNELGLKSDFYKGHRITSKRTMEITAAVQDGLINSKLSAYLLTNGIKSIGLNGIDMNLFRAEYLNEKLGFVGNPIPISDTKWFRQLLSNNIVPIFSSICRDNKGNLMNVNADLFTGAVAKLFKANNVFFLSDVQGVKINGQFHNSLSVKDLHQGLNSGEISNGMIPKIQTCLSLLSNGVKNIWIGNEIKWNANNNYTRGTWIVN